ncbi:hypothetical protein CRD60_06900 [Bifidobacterium aemilianum]|uniref:TM2 domain-containing protein n=1 Tax=Bifidobacterium aemilianum TaxID=2493120 RepID=A0A366K6X1_9BIFI|nr:TM2 domain-containing protein [Bifidobacterium aemilianum]RBP97485.1 hypothetical protein CRD60_06900 [Bifidobacterium aemilianum]
MNSVNPDSSQQHEGDQTQRPTPISGQQDQPTEPVQPSAPQSAAASGRQGQPTGPIPPSTQQPDFGQGAAQQPPAQQPAYQGFAAPAYAQPAQPGYQQQYTGGQPGNQQYSPYQQPPAQPGYQQSYTPGYGPTPMVTPLGYVRKSKLAAGLLGIFLGFIGVHNFYLGYTGKAVAQLLLTLLGWIVVIGPAIAGIWGLIEGILVLSSSYGSPWHRDANGVELED